MLLRTFVTARDQVMLYVPGGASNSARGLTLPEMLIRMTILAILLSIAAPAMKNIIADRRVAAIAQQVYGSVVLARSEAVKRRIPVSLCRTEDGNTCSDVSGGWESGWLIFEDINDNGEIDGDDQLIRVYGAVTELVELDWNNGISLGFNNKGHARKSGRFTLCEGTTGGHESREVVLSLTGRTRVEESGSC
ncbi:MAG: GspH/FimT family pseudopilin [Endozoicomonas sp.]